MSTKTRPRLQFQEPSSSTTISTIPNKASTVSRIPGTTPDILFDDAGRTYRVFGDTFQYFEENSPDAKITQNREAVRSIWMDVQDTKKGMASMAQRLLDIEQQPKMGYSLTGENQQTILFNSGIGKKVQRIKHEDPEIPIAHEDEDILGGLGVGGGGGRVGGDDAFSEEQTPEQKQNISNIVNDRTTLNEVTRNLQKTRIAYSADYKMPGYRQSTSFVDLVRKANANAQFQRNLFNTTF
jgi:hypothetical protein